MNFINIRKIKNSIRDSIKQCIKDNKWSRYNATESEVIIKSERNEYPHCIDHHQHIHKIEFDKIIFKKLNKTLFQKLKNNILNKK